MKSNKKMKIVRIAFLIAVLLGVTFCKSKENIVHGHVFDEAGIISASDVPKYEWLLDLIEKESDLDIKFLFLKTIRPATIEEVAVEKMSDYGIGIDGREERGVLFLYVMDEKRLRIEVGYGLEAYFPDSFVGYLIRNQADAFFNASNQSLGLRLLIRILQHRIREAKLNRDYDPTILDGGREFSYLSGGAGAAGNVGMQHLGQAFKRDQLGEEDRGRFKADNTVDGTFNNYIEWLYGRKFDPNVDLFTKDSLSILNRFPMTPAYFDYILMLYAGKQHKVVECGNLAVLFFTDDPIASPLFFKRINGVWKLDIAAELRNSRNHVGGVYTWAFNPESKDEFARAFKDLLVNMRGYYRFRDGDNRELPVKVDVQKG
jgi:hypothetical protein